MENFISNDQEDFFDRIKEALNREDFKGAEELLDEYLEDNSEDIQSLLLKSLIKMGMGDLFGAIIPLEEIVNTESSNGTAWHSLTNYYYMALKCDKAIESCDKFLVLEGTKTSEEAIEVRHIKVRSLYAQGKFNDALVEIEDLLKLNPINETMIVYKAKICNRLGYYNYAKKLLIQIINVISDEGLLGHAYYVLAMSYHHLGQMDKSYDLVIKSAELNDEFGMRWLKLKMAAEWQQQSNQNND